MGQKTNATIFRFGIKNNEWKSKYFEKNHEEHTFYTFQNLEIKKYLEQFLKRNSLIFHDCRLHCNVSTLHIFVSFYSTINSIFFINMINTNQKIKLKKKKKIKKTLKQKTNENLVSLKVRLTILKKYKQLILTTKYQNKKLLKKNNFLEQLLESLSFFTNKKFKIFLTFQNLNKGLSLKLNKNENEDLKKKLFFLRSYLKRQFFKETINILLISIRLKNSAQLLANFIAKQMGILKRHNYFLIFLKRTLTLFIFSKFSKVDGIKINLKGRFNGAPRARNRIIEIGNVPVQTLNSNIQYYQTISFTPNGTFGVKVWINEK